jgi:hypothetical protein
MQVRGFRRYPGDYDIVNSKGLLKFKGADFDQIPNQVALELKPVRPARARAPALARQRTSGALAR